MFVRDGKIVCKKREREMRGEKKEKK